MAISKAQTGAIATAVGLAVGIAGSILVNRATSTYLPPWQWWGSAPTVIAPCPILPPGPHPYRGFTNPIDGSRDYLRPDGTVRPMSGSPSGHFCGQVGSEHITCYTADLGEGMMELFIASGTLGPDGYPTEIYPAPPQDFPIEGHPDQTICDKYRNGNGPRAKPCPSGHTLAAYSLEMEHIRQWTASAPARNAQIASQCNRTPTPGGATPSPAPITPPPAPTVPPICPTCAVAVTCQPTITRTPTPTKTRTPCASCSPTPTASSGIDPSVTPCKNCGRFTPTQTPSSGIDG